MATVWKFGSHRVLVSACALGIAILAQPVAAVFMPLGPDSGWEYEANFGSPANFIIEDIVTSGTTTSSAGGTTRFTLRYDFGNAFIPLSIRFKSILPDQRQHFFMMDMVLDHSIDWKGVLIRTSDLRDPFDAIGLEEHPIWAHLHTRHTVTGGPFYDGLTPIPFMTDGVPEALFKGDLAANDSWDPKQIRMHDMSSTAYFGMSSDLEARKGNMDFDLLIQPMDAPPVLLLMAGGLLGMSVVRLRRRLPRTRAI